MNDGQIKTLDVLQGLSGVWTGRGTASYPTIPTFRYREELTLTFVEGKAYLHYNQRTWRFEENGAENPSHWETGFWRVLAENEIELLCAQSGGRVEAGRGLLTPTGGGFVLNLASVLLGPDPRVAQTRRTFSLQGKTLQYALEMQTGVVPSLTLHVAAHLERVNYTAEHG